MNYSSIRKYRHTFVPVRYFLTKDILKTLLSSGIESRYYRQTLIADAVDQMFNVQLDRLSQRKNRDVDLPIGGC